MKAYRKKPEIGKTDSSPSYSNHEDNPIGCIWLPLVIVISYFVLSAIIRVTSNSGSKLDQIVCYGTLVCFVTIMLLGARDLNLKSQARKAEKKKWAKACTTALLTIVDRHEAVSWWDDYSNRYHNVRNSLDLEMNSDQEATSQDRAIVNVEVSQYVYDRLKECKTVRVYYMPEFPLIFLLEEEL